MNKPTVLFLLQLGNLAISLFMWGGLALIYCKIKYKTGIYERSFEYEGEQADIYRIAL